MTRELLSNGMAVCLVSEWDSPYNQLWMETRMQVRLCEVSLFMVGHDGSGYVWDLTIPLQKSLQPCF